MTVQYENLTGASGQSINFRPPRFRPKELFESSGPETIINGIDHHLFDISMSGLAAIDRQSTQSPDIVGREVPIRLLSENSPLFEAKGTVVRFEETKIGSKIAVNFTDQTIDLKKLASAYHDAIFQRKLDRARTQNNDAVSKEYRLLCADTLHWLRMNRAILTEFEDRSHTGRDDALRNGELVNNIFDLMITEWRRIVEQANRLTEPMMASRSERFAAKSLTESLLTPEMVLGPVWHRSFHKPLGYPGDFRIMDSVYSGADSGNSVYARLLHRLGLDVLRLVVSRKDAMRDIIFREISEADVGRPARVTNLACGSAQEIIDILGSEKIEKPVELCLIDQDLQALNFSYDRAYPSVVRNQDSVSLRCFHSSFTELMRGGALTDRLPPQDLIYTLGLFDYFKQPRARILAKTLYDRLAPSGLLVIGNLKPSPVNCRWAAEFICDWSMIYRNEDQMMDLAHGLPGAQASVLEESSQQVYLLCIRKPSSD